MHRPLATALCFISLVTTTTLFGMQDPELKTSKKVANILLRSNDIEPQSSEGVELHPIIAWMWRGDNYKKPCNAPRFKPYHERIVAIKTLREKYDALDGQTCPDWDSLKMHQGTVDGINIILAFQIYQKTSNSKQFINQIMQQLYKNVRDEKLPLKPLLKYLEKHPVTITDIEGSHEGTCPDNCAITKLITLTSLLLKNREKAPFMWRARKDGAPHRVTIGNFTLITDPLNHRIEFEVKGKKTVALDCHEVSQLVFDKKGFFVCASTLNSKKENSHLDFQGALVVDFTTERYSLIDHPCPTTSDINTPLIPPQITCKKGIVAINWHENIDILYLPTNSLSRYSSKTTWIESAILSPKGTSLMIHEKLPGYGTPKYAYKLINLTKKTVLLADHLTDIAPKKAPCESQLVCLLSGIGVGKATCGEKRISKAALVMQHNIESEN